MKEIREDLKAYDRKSCCKTSGYGDMKIRSFVSARILRLQCDISLCVDYRTLSLRSILSLEPGYRTDWSGRGALPTEKPKVSTLFQNAGSEQYS